MATTGILATALGGFTTHIGGRTIKVFDKIGFDLDTIGRQREIAYIVEKAKIEYEKAGMRVNIAVWNMHVPIDGDSHFNQLIESGLRPMGRGGGFRIVVFRGSGFVKNNGALGFDNWRCSGNVAQRGNICTFKPT